MKHLIFIFIIFNIDFLGNLSHSDDRLQLVFVRLRASSVNNLKLLSPLWKQQDQSLTYLMLNISMVWGILTVIVMAQPPPERRRQGKN